MKKMIVIALLLTVTCANVSSMDLLPGMEINPKGILTIDGVVLKIVHYDDKWGPVDQSWLGEKPSKEVDGTLIITGTQPSKKGEKFDFIEKLKKNGEALEVSYDFTSAGGVGTNVLALNVNLPVADYSGESLLINGQKVLLPAKHQGQQVYSGSKVTTITIPLNKGNLLISGSFSLYIQDGRQWKGKSFQVRIGFPITKGEPVKKSSMSLKMEITEDK